MNDPIMQFDSYTILKINYKSFPEDDLEKELAEFKDNFKDHQNHTSDDQDVQIMNQIGIGFSDDQNRGLVMMTISIFDEKFFRTIDLEIAGEYEFNFSQNESEKIDLLKVNGVAILYPYARSIISTITSLNSPNALLLPTIRTSLVKEQE